MRIPILPLLPLAALALLAACGGGMADDAAPTLGALDTLPSPAAPGSSGASLATGPDGRAWLSWTEALADSSHALRVAALEGGAWTAPRTVAQGRGWFVNWADFPTLAVLPGGRMAAHWLERSGEGKYAYDVRIAQSADDGATWSAPVTPHRDGVAAEHGFVSLFAGAGDSLGAVWLDGRKYAQAEPGEAAPREETMLAATSLAPDGALGAERQVDARICDCCQTGAATTSQGPVVVYRDRSPDEIRDIYVVRRVGGRWTEPRPVHRDGWQMPACPVNGPQVDARGERVAVAWFTGARDTARVLLAFSDDAGASFGVPVRIDAGRPLGRVDVELLDDGAALVSWLEGGEEGRGQVRVRRAAPGAEPGEPRVVTETGTERGSGFPRMTRAGDAVVFAWTEPGERPRVRTARMAIHGGGER